MPTEHDVFERIDKTIERADSYREAHKLLERLPPGYLQCFAFNYIDADICNGGISQAYRNSTWSLMPMAVAACDTAESQTLSSLLRAMILYYHQSGRSKLKRQINDDYFIGIAQPVKKTLSQLEDEYFQLEHDRSEIVTKLCEMESELLWGAT